MDFVVLISDNFVLPLTAPMPRSIATGNCGEGGDFWKVALERLLEPITVDLT
jgi:hypothetical protein